MRRSQWGGNNTMLTSKLMFCWISQIHVDGCSQDERQQPYADCKTPQVTYLLGWYLVRSLGKGQVDILLDNQSASCTWPANQPCNKMSTYQTLGWPDRWWGRTVGLTTLGPSPGSQHSHWFPFGEWPTWPRPGKWHKWALQHFIYLWHYLQGLFAVLYLHDLITYSWTKCTEML